VKLCKGCFVIQRAASTDAARCVWEAQVKSQMQFVAFTCAGLFVLLVACAPTSMPSPVPISSRVTVSLAPALTARPVLEPTRTPIVITMKETEVPRSYFSLTVTISATATELKVGDTISVTVIITNTGKLGAHQAYCDLRGWLEDGTPNDYLPNPIIEPGYQQRNSDGIVPGEVQTCIFTLRAAHPGTVLLEGTYGGRVYFHVDGDRYVGESSPRLKIHVEPASP
jgi:hypothetical protein